MNLLKHRIQFSLSEGSVLPIMETQSSSMKENITGRGGCMSQKRKDKKGRILKDNEYQRSDGKYEYKYEDTDGNRKSAYSWRLVATDITPSGKRAGLSLREKEKIIQQKLDAGLRVKPKEITLNDFFGLHMQIRTFADATRENYTYMWNRFVRDDIGKKAVTDIKKSDILRFYARHKDKGLENGTIQIFQKLIRPAIQLAVDDYIISNNPADGCCKNYPEEDTDKQALTEEQIDIFLRCVSKFKSKHRYDLLFRVMLGTCCRIGEIIGLTWDNIDMKERTITIDHSLLYRKINGKFRFYIKEPKTARGVRVIPMTEDVYECMKELRKNRFSRQSDVEVDGYRNFIFTSMSGKPVYPMNVNKVLYRIVDEYNKTAEEKLPHISNHIFRHTGCTRMGDAEVDLSSMVYIMGHADAKRIQKTYDHVNLQRIRKQMQKLDAQRGKGKEQDTGEMTG